MLITISPAATVAAGPATGEDGTHGRRLRADLSASGQVQARGRGQLRARVRHRVNTLIKQQPRAVFFGVLGPVEAHDAAGRIQLKGERHRAVLARLIIA